MPLADWTFSATPAPGLSAGFYPPICGLAAPPPLGNFRTSVPTHPTSNQRPTPNMNDHETRRYHMFGRAQTFDKDHPAARATEVIGSA